MFKASLLSFHSKSIHTIVHTIIWLTSPNYGDEIGPLNVSKFLKALRTENVWVVSVQQVQKSLHVIRDETAIRQLVEEKGFGSLASECRIRSGCFVGKRWELY